jgi:hypothetical protein
MNVEKLSMDKDQARDLYRRYQESRAGMTPNDRAIAAIYKRIAQGKLIIRALASIAAAGLGADGLPKLAIMRADIPKVACACYFNEIRFDAVHGNGRAFQGYAKDRYFKVSMPGASSNTRSRVASVPLIPVHLRPRKALGQYHVLWEADWNQYPVDPYLLRRFGQDAWVVVAAWDLTDVERAVMSTQLHG